MTYKLVPTIDILDLENEVRLQFGDIIPKFAYLADYLFGDDYNNDSYKIFYFREMEEFTGESWQNEKHIHIKNCVKSILQDLLPGYGSVLIDVSW